MVMGASYLTGIIDCQTRKENPNQTLSDFTEDFYVVRPKSRRALTESASDANLFVPSRQLEAHRALVGCVYGEAASQGPG
jgi:hypothetical protein